MIAYLEELLRALRPAFSRRAAFVWFVVVFAGFVTRSDLYGVTSVIRALGLLPACYPCLLHFFHSSAWTAEDLFAAWATCLLTQKSVARVAGRVVFLGDHTKQPKEARRMPQVITLYQDSETSSKPSFFRGHQWGCLALLGRAAAKSFALPLWAEIHPTESPDSRATRLVRAAGQIAARLQVAAFLVLDAFFAVGPVFLAAALFCGRLHILTRAKKNIVAYAPPPPRRHQRGRPRIYGEKLKLFTLFDSLSRRFRTTDAVLYRRKESVRYLVLDLLWKPIKGPLRFFLIESSRGRIILMTSDFTLAVLDALQLYDSRVTIESLFHCLKNLLGGLAYHFWSKYLAPVSRRPSKRLALPTVSSRPKQTRNTAAAIQKFLAIHFVVLGTLQLLAAGFGAEIQRHARCWLRTASSDVPSEFIARTALANLLRANIARFAKNLITQIILLKQSAPQQTSENTLAHNRKAA